MVSNFLKKTIKIDSDRFMITALAYLLLPVLVFFVGYLKIYWAIFFGAVIVGTYVLFIKEKSPSRTNCVIASSCSIDVKPIHILLLCMFAVCVCVLAGVGEFVWCGYDHRVRWATLKDLVDYKWPVIYDLSKQQNPEVLKQLGTGEVAFSYYLSFWLIPALFGKMFGLLVGRIALLLWAASGLLLIFLGIRFFTRANLLLSTVVLVFVGGLDVLPYLMNIAVGKHSSPETWGSALSIFGFFPQIMMVVNQCIPIWLIVIVLLLSQKTNYIGFVASIAFVYSPWATFGLFPIAIYLLLSEGDFKKIFKHGNLVVPAIVLIVFGSFYLANPDASSERGFIWDLYDDFPSFFTEYVFTILIEYGFWFVLLRKQLSKSKLLVFILIELLIYPLFRMSDFNDWLMRGTIAPLLILSIFVVNMAQNSVNNLKKKTKAIRSVVTLLFVLASSFSAGYYMYLAVYGTSINYSYNREHVVYLIDSFGNIRDENQVEMVADQFFVYNYEDSFFYRVFANT